MTSFFRNRNYFVFFWKIPLVDWANVYNQFSFEQLMKTIALNIVITRIIILVIVVTGKGNGCL